jgi:hypothetical protein
VALTTRSARSAGDARWAVLIIEGRALPVRGFTEVTAMYRRYGAGRPTGCGPPAMSSDV